jgi:hypothetical protein
MCPRLLIVYEVTAVDTVTVNIVLEYSQTYVVSTLLVADAALSFRTFIEHQCCNSSAALFVCFMFFDRFVALIFRDYNLANTLRIIFSFYSYLKFGVRLLSARHDCNLSENCFSPVVAI